IVLAGRRRLFALAARSAYRAAQELGLLVDLLRKALAPALLLAAACGFHGLLLALGRRLTALGLAVPVTIVVTVLITVLVAIPIAEAAMVPAEGPVLPAAALVPVAGLVAPVLARWRLGLLLRQLRLKAVVDPLLAVLVA